VLVGVCGSWSSGRELGFSFTVMAMTLCCPRLFGGGVVLFGEIAELVGCDVIVR